SASFPRQDSGQAGQIPPDLKAEIARRRESCIGYLLCSDEWIIQEIENEKKLQAISTPENEYHEQLLKEFDRQIENLAKKGFPKLAGVDEEEFTAIFEPLKEHLKELSSKEFKEGHIPFVVVPREKLLALEKKIPLMELEGKKGFTTLNLSEFKTAEGVEIPESMAYLVVDVENGKEMLDKSAYEAVKQFKKESRSPLTSEEGVALILQYPEIIKDHHMDLPGSRHGADNVAYLWLSEGKPKLFWSWAYGSGSRLGSASCGSRVGP
ncbi:MAG: DUF5701 family protein, partial [Patescibacteria group bacterium]